MVDEGAHGWGVPVGLFGNSPHPENGRMLVAALPLVGSGGAMSR